MRVYGPEEPIEREEPSSWSVVGPPLLSDLTFDWLEVHINSRTRQTFDELRLGKTWSSAASPWIGRDPDRHFLSRSLPSPTRKNAMSKPMAILVIGFVLGTSLVFAATARAQRQMEHLGRGMVAIPQGDGKVYLGWRLLGTDPEDIAFNV